LGETYEEIFARNVQGAHSLSLAVRTLQWVLCAFRPFDIEELRAAVAIDDDVVTGKLLLDICSNFIHVDSKGFVRLAHISVKEYLERKKIDQELKFSSNEAHSSAAIMCIAYWSKVPDNEAPPIQKKHRKDLPPLSRDIGCSKPHSDSFYPRQYIQQRCSHVGCSEERREQEVKRSCKAASASWLCYASLYWASHYQMARRDSLHPPPEMSLWKEISTFLDGRTYNLPLIKWMTQMSSLRYAFHLEGGGSGLGDRTPSPGPGLMRSSSRGPSKL
jgi:hypothetical protein